MTTFRTTVVLDFDVDEGTDPDEFHDALRDKLESAEAADAIAGDDFALESVREINVEELDED